MASPRAVIAHYGSVMLGVASCINAAVTLWFACKWRYRKFVHDEDLYDAVEGGGAGQPDESERARARERLRRTANGAASSLL